MLPDYYAVLGVSKDASYLEIKAAYRSLAMEHHPDKHGGDLSKEQLFKRINEAYSVLSHTDTKLSYDKQILWQREQAQRPSYPPNYPPSYPPRPPVYTAPKQQPYQYTRRTRPYASTQYIYSKWTLMYGKIFVVLLIMFVVLFPVMLEYSFSNYYYDKGLAALANGDYLGAEDNFVLAMRDLGGSSVQAATKGAELKLELNANFEAINYIDAGLDYAETKRQKARLYYLRGLASRNIHHMEEANANFIDAMRYGYPRDSVYIELAPLLAYELKEYSSAISIYDSLILYFPANYDHLLNRGFCYQKSDNHLTAIIDFDHFIDKKGVNGSVLYLKAISQVSLNEMDSACANFSASLELGISNAATFLKLYCEPEKEIVYPSANPF